MERELTRINHEEEILPSCRYESLTAFIADESCGAMTYFWSEGGQCFDIEHIIVKEKFQGMGIGKKLLNAFSAQLGSGQPIHAIVVHAETIDVLAKKYKEVAPEYRYFVPIEEFSQVPFVRILQSGGISVENISVTPGLLGYEHAQFDIEFWGRTN